MLVPYSLSVIEKKSAILVAGKLPGRKGPWGVG